MDALEKWHKSWTIRRWLWWSRSPLRDWYYEIRNRFFAKYYLIDIKDMPRGAWKDADYKMFHAVFQILVDFVEQEEGHQVRWSDPDSDTCHIEVRAWKRASWFDRWWNKARWDERLGIAALEVGSQMDDPNSVHFHEHCESQAEKDRKALALYKWYKFERPNRPDSFDMSTKPEFAHYDPFGNKTNNMFDDSTTDKYSSLMNDFTEEYSEWLRTGGDMDEFYEEEDTRKAQELLAIRRGLWT